MVCALALVLAMGRSAQAEGRFASVGLGGTASSQLDTDHPPSIPALLRYAPEIQLAWGLHLGDALIVTRFDMLGLMLPIGPAGAGFDVGAGWAPGWQRTGWAPLVRGFIGGLILGSGGEMWGPDHSSYGFRTTVEAGAVHRTRVPAGKAALGVVVGAQLLGLFDVAPCSPSGDCATALVGMTARFEAHLTF
ncbi:MAG: hypothetical protein SFX73_07105 [Kofleriaceae bacterium]|nr:hypothetical protein [Kofleriaceae bacterium]